MLWNLSNKAILHFFLHWLDCIDIRKNVLKEISSTDYSNIYLTDAKLIEVFFLNPMEHGAIIKLMEYSTKLNPMQHGTIPNPMEHSTDLSSMEHGSILNPVEHSTILNPMSMIQY